ncbi:MAG: tRNA (cytidine(34)-2'-O)-methyltransferase [Gammaproteobacteria bacterium]|nr:tRNA (cytidine(34)-2'-O)-methyltransferase [Gammaproteobacteria bacterium]
MFNIVLYQPEIPPNTGNVIRLAANTGCRLHLIRPLGFELEDTKLRRAGLDYHEWAEVQVHDSFGACMESLGQATTWAFTRHAHARHDRVSYSEGDVLLFGPETRGLPRELVESLPETQRLRLPMRPGNRSLNLSNAVAVAVYEAWRQHDFGGADE